MKDVKYSMYTENAIVRPKKLIKCFSGTVCVTFNSPASKIFIAFSVFAFKNRLYIANCQFRSAAFAAVLFADWLVRILKVKIFQESTPIHRSIAFH